MNLVKSIKAANHANARALALQLGVIAIFFAISATDVMAQVGGGTGNSTAVQTRVTGVMTGFQTIMFTIGGAVISAAGMWTGYGMATGNKKWSDCANVCYGAGFAGASVMIAGWLFS